MKKQKKLAPYNLRPITVLVTGGAGFIGSHLCEKLLHLGHKVVCVDNFNTYYDPRIKWQNIKDLRKHPNFVLHKADIRDTKKIFKIFRKYSAEKDRELTAVIHLAARAGVRPSLNDPLLYEDVNIKGTLNILEACRQYKVKKLIFGSSSSVYGNNKKIPFSETDPVDDPISPYAATKKAGELLCYNYHHLYGLPVVCLRFFTVYGPKQRPEMAIHKFIRTIDQCNTLVKYGKGDTSRDYTYVEDIINGIIAALNKKLAFEIINLGNSKTITLSKLIQTIEKNMHKKARIKQLPEQPGDVKRTFANISKAKKLLGYRPHTDISTGIKNTIAWYYAQGKNQLPL